MARSGVRLIGLLTDFGLADWYVASMKAVILRICPRAQIVDISHEIPPQDTMVGAFTLAAAAAWFPPRSVFACVVDPGVGTARYLIASHADRHYFVGPDNGLLSLVFERARRLSLVRLTNPRYWLPETSRTFHGRDILAPVAAHLACGCPLRQLGIPLRRYRALALPPLKRQRHAIRGCILHIDAFGNLITNLPVGLVADQSGQLHYKQRPVRMVSCYAQGKINELISLPGSCGYLELAIRNASAARRTRARRGEPVELRRL